MNDYPTDFSFTDCEVTMVCFDYRGTLSVVSPALHYAGLSIATRFDLTNPGRDMLPIEPAAEISATGLGALHGLLHQTVVSGYLDVDGTARFAFSSGATIAIPPHETLEAFDVNKNETGEKWISCPGGEIAYWPPNPSSEE